MQAERDPISAGSTPPMNGDPPVDPGRHMPRQSHAFEVIHVFALADGSGGNALGLKRSRELPTSEEMQRLAKQLGFSETIFLCDEEPVRARIFTPGVEVAFAGHPLVGAAWHLGQTRQASSFVIKTPAGPVACTFDSVMNIACIQAPQKLSRFNPPSIQKLAKALRLDPEAFAPQPAGLSIGLPFIVVELHTRQQLRAVSVDLSAFRAAVATTGADAIFCWTRAANDELVIDARMFSPLDGIGEDPATGSACGALAAGLAELKQSPLTLRVRQGEDMGQPCEIFAQVDHSGRVTLSGRCVPTGMYQI